MLKLICAFLKYSGSLVLLFIVFLAGCSSNQLSTTAPASPATPATPTPPSGGSGSGGGGGTGGGGGSGVGTGTGGGGGTGSGASGTTGAYVYVIERAANTGPNQIFAYTADGNGQLTPVAGSPFNENVGSIAANGAYLMAATTSEINSYKIGSDGSISLASQTNYQQLDSSCQRWGHTGNFPSAGPLFFDHTGQSLYAGEYNIDCSQNHGIASFAVDASTGKLNYLGDDDLGFLFNLNELSGQANPLTGNNVYAYSAGGNGQLTAFFGLMRSGSGLLGTNPNFTKPSMPATGGTVYGYVPLISTADPTNHVAIAEQGVAPGAPPGAVGPAKLATFTADANGNLTTTDTYATMPSTSISLLAMAISPSGTLLAVAGVAGSQGTGGLQVFHFNGANPITSDTGLLTTDNIAKVFWDNNNHLYAITWDGGTNPGKLYVFTVTDTTATLAPGSPYTLEISYDLAVQPK